jgi:MFS family permease
MRSGSRSVALPGASASLSLFTLAALLAGVLLLVIVVAIVPLAYAAHQLIDSVFPIAFAPAFGAVGVIVALRQPHNPIGWILIAVALFVGGSFDIEAYAYLIYHVGDHGLPLGRVAVALAPCWYLGIVLLPLPILLFPDGRLPSARWRWVLWAYAASAVVMLGTVAWLDSPALLDRHIRVDSSGQIRAIDYPSGWESAALHVTLVVFLVLTLAFVLRQVLAFRRSTGARRQQLKSMLTGGAILIAGLLISVVAGGFQGQLWYAVSNLAFLGINALPIGIGVGILRYRLYDIDRLVSRTLSYAILTALLVMIYVGVVTLATRALPIASPIGVAASTLASAALFNPLRTRIQRAVDSRFNRARYDADAIVAVFRAHLRDAIDLESVSMRLGDAVDQTVAPGLVSLWIRPPLASRDPGSVRSPATSE